MFEVGKTYSFRIVEGGEEISFDGTIDAYEHPLIKLKSEPLTVVIRSMTPEGNDTSQTYPADVKIINITSANFISAEEKGG